jgi:Fe-S-cluster containining protein
MNLCARCAALGKTCCQGTDVLLTRGDLVRITAHTRRTDFYEHRKPCDPTCLGEQDDPNWLLYTMRADGTRRVVQHSPSGDCLFLTPTGCSLPAEVRPLICRLHPLTYTEARICGSSPDCPVGLLDAGEEFLHAVGVNPADGEVWQAKLYRELREEICSAERADEPDRLAGFAEPLAGPLLHPAGAAATRVRQH